MLKTCNICEKPIVNPIKIFDRSSGRLIDTVCSKCISKWRKLYSSETYKRLEVTEAGGLQWKDWS